MASDATVSIFPDMGRHRREEESPKDKDSGKSSSGKHTTKRAMVGISADWYAVMKQIAAKKRQPVLWHLIELAMNEADKLGIPHPRPPWEAGEESDK